MAGARRWATLLVAAVSMPAAAGVLVFDGFDDTSLLTLNGVAATAATGDGTVLRLTPAIGSAGGSAFSSATIDATTFSTKFAFRFTKQGGTIFDCNTTDGADGIVFVVQSISSSIGGVGQGIGYAGIGNSVGVEFDNWCNAANNDPSSSHVGIDLDGNVNHGAGAPFATPLATDLDDGEIRWAWVDYDGTTMRVYVNTVEIQPFQPIVQRDLDLPAILGQDTGYVGFTSGTGADWANHDVIYWEYTDFSPTCIGDFDDNDVVDGFDLGVLLANWNSDLDVFDLNGDDVVDGQDIGVLLANWGACP